MNKEIIKKLLSDSFIISEHNGIVVINNKFFCPNDDKDYPIGIKENDGKIILSDMSNTYARLIDNDIDIEDEDLFEYVEKIEQAYYVSYDRQTHEFFILCEKSNITLAFANLLQAIILISNIYLQLEEE